MKIGGFQKFSLTEYPGKISCVIFTQGCNFKCPYCHNPELVYPHLFGSIYDENEIIQFLFNRKEQINSVVITGGEPTIQEDLCEFIQKIKGLGYLIKLNTNGSKPNIVNRLLKLKLINYIAMDIKATFEKYHILSGCNVNYSTIIKSIQIIKDSGIEHEFRTTLYNNLLNSEDEKKIKVLTEPVSNYLIYNHTKPPK